VKADVVEDLVAPEVLAEDARDRAPAGAARVEQRAVDVEEEDRRAPAQTPSSRAISVSWISLVPSVMVIKRASRKKRSTGNSVMYP
jgi:hypothetical protein